MSDIEEQMLDLPEAEQPEEKPAPKKKVARKRTAKKAAKKAARKALAKQEAADDIPEVFSADPEYMDDYGDKATREERAPEPDAKDTGDKEEAKDDKRAEKPTPENKSDNSRDEDDRENDSGDNQRGRENRKPHHQHNQQKGNFQRGGNQQNNQKGNKQNRFDKKKDKFNKKKDRFQKGGGNNKKGGWRKDFEAANDDDVDPPTFDSLVEWELFQDADALSKLVEEVATGEPLDYNEVYNLKVPEMEQWAKDNGVEWDGPPSRRKLLRAILAKAGEDQRVIKAKGIVEELEDGIGFVTFSEDSYRLRTESPYIAPQLFNQYGLQRGHEVEVIIHAPREEDTTPFVIKVDTVMGMEPEAAQHLTPFKELVPYYPTDRIIMESEQGRLGKWDNISMRIVDLLSPVGLGQRGLIVAPPRTGKTVLLQGIANAIRTNKPEVHLIVLLVDERPEEVTDFKRSVKGAEVISSTFDESAESHVHAAEMVSEKARRMVEAGQDVIILLDSITRLARAYNTMMPSSGKILSGGVEASALQKPKRFFGSARNIEDGGSLTILGTALVETGSKMDEVIFEEFKGTGNMELHLDRELSNKRVFPALSFEKSGTRKEGLLYHPDEMQKVYGLRRAMKGVGSVEAMEMLIQRVKKTQTNAQFLMSLR